MPRRRNVPIGGPTIPTTPTGPIMQIQVPMPVLGTFNPGSNYEGSQVKISQGKANIGILGTIGGLNLGPLGYNPNELIIMIQLDMRAFLTFQAVLRQINQNITESELLTGVINDIYTHLKPYMMGLINSIVPRDSGRLRNAMELSIAGGRGSGAQGGSTTMISGLNPFMVILNTGMVSYAPVVNKMPDQWLIHPGTHGIRSRTTVGRPTGRPSGRTKVPSSLNDPQAETLWFDKVRDQSRLYAQQLWNNMLFGGYLFTLASKIVAGYQYLTPHPPGTTPTISTYTEQQIIQLLLGVRFG